MFPIRGLLKVTCPELGKCTLSPCVFSHQASLPPSASNGAAIASTSNPSKSLQIKRQASSATEEQSHKKLKTVNTYDPVAHKLQREQSSSLSRAPAPPTSTTTANAQQPLKTAAQATLPAQIGPPRIVNPKGPAHTPSITRQKLLTTLYEQFQHNYSALPDPARAKILAALHAKQQEQALYDRSTKMTYRNAVISALARLKKRGPVKSEDDPACGTLEQEAERVKQMLEEEKGKLDAAKLRQLGFVHSKETLAKFGYDVEVPAGVGGDQPTEEGNVKKCDRCGKEYVVKADLEESERVACSFHWGRQITEKINGTKHRVWSCCPTPNAPTCSTGPHVFKDTSSEALHSRIGFLPTRLVASPASTSASGQPAIPILALDCELVYTTSGMALARLTVIDERGHVVLDAHVKPHGAVVDLNTRFSGVKEDDLRGVEEDLKQVRDRLGELMDEETILVGHGLENDLRALRIVHLAVIDTAILFPHPNGGTWRHALRNLTREHLGKFIQDGHSGHSATEDAVAALELVRFKMKQKSAGLSSTTTFRAGSR